MYENLNGTGSFSPFIQIDYTTNDAHRIELANVDSDSDLDIIVGTPGSDYVGWYENNPVCDNASPPLNWTACGFLQLSNGQIVTQNGFYTDTINNAAGCDSVLNINLTILQSSSSSVSPSVCDAYTSPSGKIWQQTGVYSDTVKNAQGCDSIININLSILNSTTSTLSPSVCDAYSSPSGNIWTQSGVYADTVLNAAGCDSVVTINLTVFQSSSSGLTTSACGSYLSPSGQVWTQSGVYSDTVLNAAGCDSVVTINLTVLQPSAGSLTTSACGSYVSPSGQVWTQSGVYIDTVSNSVGCDSVINIQLTLTQINDSIYGGLSGLMAVDSGSYRWLDCMNGMAVIPDANAQSFVPSANGSFAVEITQNGCVDTSDCVSITGIGLLDPNLPTYTIRPNPNRGQFVVEWASPMESSVMVLINASGGIVWQNEFRGTRLEFFDVVLSPGVYSLFLQRPEGFAPLGKVVVY